MTNKAVKTFQVDIASNPSLIIQTAEPIASNTPGSVPVINIMAVTPVYFDYTSASAPQTTVVTGYSTAPDTISFAYTDPSDFVIGQSVVISGSTSNDGTYVVTAVDGSVPGTVTLTVGSAIVALPVDGSITFTPTSGNVENNDTGDNFRETYPYKRMTVVVMDLYDGQKLSWELQSITNQPTWSTGNRDALNAAVAAINALL